MRGVGREIEQERLRPILFDEPHALTEPDVGAVALELFELPVPFVGVIEVVVAPVIRGLPNPAATMPDDILKAPVLRTMRSVVAEVPLADHPGHIAGAGKQVCDRLFVPVHHRAPRTGSVTRPCTGVIAGHQRRARGRAERADMEIREAHGLGVEAIQIRRLEDRIPVTGQIAVALIVSHHEDDVGLARGGCELASENRQMPVG